MTREALRQALSGWQVTIRTGSVVREEHAEYASDSCHWDQTISITLNTDTEFPWAR